MNEPKKPKCEKCKKSGNVVLKTENWTLQELEDVMKIIDKYGLTPQQISWIYNLFNRIFKENKQPGCGKCFVNIARRLKIKYAELTK
jgi:hypothetical protein